MKSVTMVSNYNWRILIAITCTEVLTSKIQVLPLSVSRQTNTAFILHHGKGVCQGCILSPCLVNFYAEYVMRSAGLDKAQAGIKIAGRNINNLRYADDTTLMAETKELNSVLKEKEESEKAGLKLNIQKTKIMASDVITSQQIDGETMESVRLYFLGLQNHCRW